MPGLALAHLLGAAVVVADLGHRVDDLLAVELEDDAEYTVDAGMVGAQVEKHEIAVVAMALHPPGFGVETQRFLLLLLALLG